MDAATKWLAAYGSVLLLVLGLGACTVSQLEPGASLSPQPDTGLVVLSVTRSGWRDFDLQVELQQEGSVLPHSIAIFARSRARDWQGGEGPAALPEAPEGRLFVLKLKPGSYRIDRWSGHSKSGGLSGDGYDISSESMGITFSVASGSIAYLGNLHIRLPKALNYNANLMRATYHVAVEEQRERDLAMLRTKHPGTALEAITAVPLQLAPPERELRYFVYNLQVGSPNRQKKMQ